MSDNPAQTVTSILDVPRVLRGGSRVLILGGTAEAADLAASLVEQGHDVITSLAGRTESPRAIPGTVISGGFGGAKGLTQYVIDNGIQVIVDATHPFADAISANADAAARATGRRLILVDRPPWQKEPGDRWIEVIGVEAARDVLPPGARVFLALGRQHIAPFATRDDVHFIIRMVDPPDDLPPFHSHDLVLGKPGDTAAETALFEAHNVTHLVSRNSGGAASYAKIEAARALAIPVILIVR